MFMDAKTLFCRFKVVIIKLQASFFTCLLSNLSIGEKATINLIPCKQFSGKVNNITIDKCTKMGDVFKVSET